MHIRIFSFIKNEIHLIEEWLKHHGPLVNWWGLHIVDNGSTDGTTMILNRYKKKYGINVYECNDFKSKGTLITDMIKKYNKQPGVCIALDADEFVYLYQNNKVDKNVNNIKNYISEIYDKGTIFCTRGWLNCVPEKEKYDNPVKEIKKFKWELTERSRCKKFTRNDQFVKIDLGFHQPVSKDMNFVDTDIVYVHYHGCDKQQRIDRCEELIIQHGMDLDTIKQQIGKPGEVKYVKKAFGGRDRVQEYMNLHNWKYEPTEDYDVLVT